MNMEKSSLLKTIRSALETVYGRHLRGVLLYGSEARGEARRGRSEIAIPEPVGRMPHCRGASQWSQRRLSGFSGHSLWPALIPKFPDNGIATQSPGGRSPTTFSDRSSASPARAIVPSSNNRPMSVTPCGTRRGGENLGNGCAGSGAQSLRASDTWTKPVRSVSDG